MQHQKEQEIVKSIIEWLLWKGFYAFRVNAGMMFQEGRVFKGADRGVSDIIGISPSGRFIALEVKTAKRIKNLSNPQSDFLEMIKKKKGISGVVSSIEDMELLLKKI